MQNTRIVAVVELPEVTFKPNKINVKSSILYMKRRQSVDHDLEQKYPIKFIQISSLGYAGSGDRLRGFDEDTLMAEIGGCLAGEAKGGEYWRSFEVDSTTITIDPTFRLDLKYWDAATRDGIANLKKAGARTLGESVTAPIRRGKSPPAETYVDENDGYALVVKAGTNVSKFGEVLRLGDFIEKNQFEEMDAVTVKDGDVLLSSTGTGTLGKCAVYRGDEPAIADGHVTILRLNQNELFPEYVCDYLRLGFGATQVQRLFTGSTGLIELTPDQVATIVVETPGGIEEQKEVSHAWRAIETKYRNAVANAEADFEESRAKFLTIAPIAPHLTTPAGAAEDATEDA